MRLPKLLFPLLIFAVSLSCNNTKKDSQEEENVKAEPIAKYIDFPYSKVIAFASVDAYKSIEFTLHEQPAIFPGDTISKTLNAVQVQQLEEVLCGKKGTVGSREQPADCFNPRHYILFLDSNARVVQYLSICFECGRRQTSKDTPASMSSLWAYFDSIGLPVLERPDWHEKYYDSVAKATKPDSLRRP